MAPAMCPGRCARPFSNASSPCRRLPNRYCGWPQWLGAVCRAPCWWRWPRALTWQKRRCWRPWRMRVGRGCWERRALLHRRVAEVLEATVPAPAVTVLAYHYAQSDEQDKAILYLEQAGDAARTRYAQTEAESAYREVITRLETLGRGV